MKTKITTTDIKTKLLNYSAIFASVPDLYVLMDTKFIIQDATDAFLNATMVKREDIIGKSFLNVFPENPDELRPTSRLIFLTSFDRVLKTKNADAMAVQKYDLRQPKELGGKFEERYWSQLNIPVFDENGQVEYVLFKAEDVTDFIRFKNNENIENLFDTPTQKMEKEIYLRAQEIQGTNRRLRHLNDKLTRKEAAQKKLFDKLQKINQIKTQFLASISNELRTPVTLILGTIKKLISNPENDDIKFDLNLIERNAYEFLRHVNDLLDISKLETKKIELYYSSCDVVKIVRHTAALFESHAGSKNITYKITTPSSISAELDVQKIQRVLVNLLTYSFRFTPDNGSIECCVRINDKRVMIDIADSGPGIPLEMRDNLFNNFFYGRILDQKKVTSLGLGLTIVKDFIELHGGSIHIETSHLGGALFKIDLPREAPAGVKIEYKGSDPKVFPKELLPEFINNEQGVQAKNYVLPAFNSDPNKQNFPVVLIVEDNYDMSQYITSVLEDEYQIIAAFNGNEGLEKVLQYKPDLVIADLLMPKMDGSDMVRAIRSHKELNTTPIIILTAKMDDEACSQLLTEGAQDYLIKPFSHLELHARVANLIQLKKASDALQLKNIELLEANNELDAFGYTVSHDLRNPVQSIIGFCTLLLDAFNLEEEARDYIKHMHYSGKRMQELINDLLTLSHALREELNYKEVNLSDIAVDVLENLQVRDPLRQVKVDLSSDLKVYADESLMRIVLDNLLSNAWKYTSKNEKATIEIGVKQIDNAAVIYIKDNGVGFAQDKANKLFVPFSRLHAEKDFPGTGVGLATVKRIIEKHSGRIWVESQPGEGATFYFQLPVTKAHTDMQEEE